MLNKRLQELSIQLFKDKNNPKTFKINSLGNYFDIIINNLTKSKSKDNILLLLKEYTHLTSHFSNELASITKNGTLSYELNKYKDTFEKNANLNISYTDAYFGIVALNEVISQWCAEKCNSVISNIPLKQKQQIHTVLGNEIIVETSFSHFNMYAPLEKYVRNFAKNNGFKDLDDFSKNMILGKNNILDFISVDSIKELSAIGLLFQGIHQE